MAVTVNLLQWDLRDRFDGTEDFGLERNGGSCCQETVVYCVNSGRRVMVTWWQCEMLRLLSFCWWAKTMKQERGPRQLGKQCIQGVGVNKTVNIWIFAGRVLKRTLKAAEKCRTYPSKKQLDR